MRSSPDNRPALDRWMARLFDDQYETRFGTGWASGTIAVFLGVALIASTLGGASVPVSGVAGDGLGLGLDWFLLNVLLLALVFVPMERVFAQRPAQSTFRAGWTTDLVHFFVSHLLVQMSAWLTLAPAAAATRLIVAPHLQATVASLPWVLQFLLDVASHSFRFRCSASRTVPSTRTWCSSRFTPSSFTRTSDSVLAVSRTGS